MTPILKKNTDYTEYATVLPGSVFKLDEHNNVQVEEATRKFGLIEIEIAYIVPGTTLFTLYGTGHVVVTANPNAEILDDEDEQIVDDENNNVG